jgi:hypothetical protein
MKRFDNEQIEEMLPKGLTENQRYYREHGYLIICKLIPEPIIGAYLELRARLGLGQAQFSDDTCYVEHPEIFNVVAYRPLMDIIRELHQCEMGLIFTLTGFKSTQRGWHQDS